MYADFMWAVADQLFNQIGKARHVRRHRRGATGAAHQDRDGHRLRLAALDGPGGGLATAAGWRIVAPSTPYAGLMNTALACDDPVVVLEHVDLYASTGPGLPGDLDHCLPVGRAAVRRQGADLTVLTYGAMTQPMLDAVAETGVDAEVIDLRWLDRASLDWETITASVEKTNRVLIAEQGAVGTSYGGWLGDEIARRLFDWLDAPVERLHGGEASPSISKVLERAAFARTEEAVAKLTEIAATEGLGA
ncbi:transketolase C-terminal domain-containing protein [Nocardioides sp.]|uniref:transketolase C-terminal domain-containing protein n=1 Tax=Nocardioides sp. TaxID=35761 RepID=UPI003527FEA3